MEIFITFASTCLKINDLFEPFNIIPSRKEEKKKIQDLTMLCSKQLGQKWYLISQKWWELWSAYVDWDIVAVETSPTDTANGNGNANADNMSDSLHQKRRPLKIDNADLLDPQSHARVLHSNLQEGTHFQVVALPVWKQLREWYGGGPEIDRQVTSVDKSIRLQLAKVQCKKLLLERQLKDSNQQEEISKKSSQTEKKK